MLRAVWLGGTGLIAAKELGPFLLEERLGSLNPKLLQPAGAHFCSLPTLCNESQTPNPKQGNPNRFKL